MLVSLFRAKIINQGFYTSFWSSAEGSHPLQDTRQHWGWITRTPLAGAVPHRPVLLHTVPANRPRLLAGAARGRLVWSKVRGTKAIPTSPSAL